MKINNLSEAIQLLEKLTGKKVSIKENEIGMNGRPIIPRLDQIELVLKQTFPGMEVDHMGDHIQVYEGVG